MYGAQLIQALLRRNSAFEFFGVGGDRMRAAGCQTVVDAKDLSVVGITEILSHLPRIWGLFNQLIAEAEERKPELAIVIDSPAFNWRVAREMHKRGIPTVYYVAPQFWAWRQGRVRLLRKYVTKALVIFPFEEKFYRERGVDTAFVGHPLVDEVPHLSGVWDSADPEAGPFRLALLPGSRVSEVAALLPVMLESVRRLSEDFPVEARLIQAPTIPRDLLEEEIDLSGLPVRIVAENRFGSIADSHLALCASGTATLEVGLLGTPMVMLYRLGRWTWLLARLLVRLPYVSLVNLVLGRKVIPELLQRNASPERIAAEAEQILTDDRERQRIRTALAELRARLGEGGASRRAAREVAAFLRGATPA